MSHYSTFTKGIILALGCSVFTNAAAAKPITMQCLVSGPDGGWIAEQIFVEYDSERDAARVVDPIILYFDKKPKKAEISEDTDKKLVVKWRLAARAGSQTTKFAYRLAYFKSNGKATVQAHPHGFANNFSARGRCQRINQPLPAG